MSVKIEWPRPVKERSTKTQAVTKRRVSLLRWTGAGAAAAECVSRNVTGLPCRV